MNSKFTTAGKQAKGNVKILLYGTSGVGKSFFATDLKNGVVLDFEQGLASAVNKDIAVYPCSVARDFTEGLEAIRDADFDAVVLDSWSEYNEKLFLVMKQIFPEKKDSMSMWSELDYQLRLKHDELMNLTMNVINLALVEDVIEEMVSKKYPMMRAKKFKMMIGAKYDLVGHLHIDEETGKRCISFEPSDERIGKNRYADIGLPSVIYEDDELWGAQKIIDFVSK